MKKQSILDNRIFNIIVNIISTVILAISITICFNVLLSSGSPVGVPSFAGYSIMSVRSNSMNPTFQKYDLIIIKRYDPAEGHVYEVGDVISYATAKKEGYTDGEKYVNTHRIVEVFDNGDTKSYATKGDHPEAPIDSKRVPSANILGKYTGTKIPKLGWLLKTSKEPKGVIFMIILPAALIVGWYLFSYLRSIGKRRVSETAPAPAMTQQYYPPAPGVAAPMPQQYYPPAAASEKDAIIQEYLRQQQAEEARKQQIIEEYLAKQKELEEAEKAKAEEAKIKAIIAEYLAQQKAAEESANEKKSQDETD